MKVALIGRPNVGKSTLFNRLVGRNTAITGDEAGITRDRRYADADLFGLKFQVIDTAGIDLIEKTDLAEAMNQQSLYAIQDADVLLFVVDASAELSDYDKNIAEWIRKAFRKIGERPLLIIKNKSDQRGESCHEKILGFGDGVAVSAEQKLGFDEIFEFLRIQESILSEKSEINGCANISATTNTTANTDLIKIAIIGRPNVGKSTLINAILGEERLIVGNQAGITRDSIQVEWNFKNRKFSLVDTAGQRKKNSANTPLDNVVSRDMWRNVKSANVILIVMDIENPFEKQDVTLARKAHDEGKIVIFVINKSDKFSDAEAEEILKKIQRRTTKEFSQVPGVACLLTSGLEKKGLYRVFNIVIKLHESWSKRIPTAPLNKWFRAAITQNPPPLINGLPIKLKYISQVGACPPAFAIFANRAEHLTSSYQRYLRNNLLESFDLYGIPLRIFVRKPDNPFDN